MSGPLSLNRVSCVLPDGRILFSRIEHSFPPRRIGLVGANGCGKTLLGNILAGLREPDEGAVSRAGRIFHVPQQPDPALYPNVAALSGMAQTLGALERIAAGSVDEADYVFAAGRWDCRERLRTALDSEGLGHLEPATATHRLSGGERQRIALLGAWLSAADWLILDEPSNHLDAGQWRKLIGQVCNWPCGLIIISHDRDLLMHVEEIAELSPQGLAVYGGDYGHYSIQRSRERAAAQRALQSLRAGTEREQRMLRQQMQNRHRHAASDKRKARSANQCQGVIDFRKERHQNSEGKMRKKWLLAHAQQRRHIAEAAARCDPEQERLMLSPESAVPAGKIILSLRGVRLPFGHPRPLSLILSGPARFAVTGDNGSGKTTLLRIIAGHTPASGEEVRRGGHCAWLEQHSRSRLDGQNAVDLLRQRNPALSESGIRTRLALLGIDATRAVLDSALLSGGERIKIALAAELYAAVPPQLLLLDEPDNHLDLPSLAALENMLNQYRGALLVVSHSAAFLRNLRLDGEIRLHCR